jgi:hypothetical protein
MNSVFKLLESEDKDEIRKAVKELIIKRINDELESFDRWLITYEDISEIVNSAVGEVIEDIKHEIKGQIKEKVMEKFKNI